MAQYRSYQFQYCIESIILIDKYNFIHSGYQLHNSIFLRLQSLKEETTKLQNELEETIEHVDPHRPASRRPSPSLSGKIDAI